MGKSWHSPDPDKGKMTHANFSLGHFYLYPLGKGPGIQARVIDDVNLVWHYTLVINGTVSEAPSELTGYAH